MKLSELTIGAHRNAPLKEWFNCNKSKTIIETSDQIARMSKFRPF